MVPGMFEKSQKPPYKSRKAQWLPKNKYYTNLKLYGSIIEELLNSDNSQATIYIFKHRKYGKCRALDLRTTCYSYSYIRDVESEEDFITWHAVFIEAIYSSIGAIVYENDRNVFDLFLKKIIGYRHYNENGENYATLCTNP